MTNGEGFKLKPPTDEEIAMLTDNNSSDGSREQNTLDKQETQHTQARKRYGKYPWDKWFNGRLHTLVQGVDFEIPIETFRISVANTARRKSVLVLTTRKGDNELVIQKFDNEEDLRTAKRLYGSW